MSGQSHHDLQPDRVQQLEHIIDLLTCDDRDSAAITELNELLLADDEMRRHLVIGLYDEALLRALLAEGDLSESSQLSPGDVLDEDLPNLP